MREGEISIEDFRVAVEFIRSLPEVEWVHWPLSRVVFKQIHRWELTFAHWHKYPQRGRRAKKLSLFYGR